MPSTVIDDAVNVYTDGSSLSHPRLGGAGLRLVVINDQGAEEVLDVPLSGFRGATNNQMELWACIQGVKEAQKHPAFDGSRRIAIHSDSRYVVENYEKALFGWSQHRWRNPNGRPVLNAPLWKELLRVVRASRKRVEFHWLKGHARDPHNRAADSAARASARTARGTPLAIVNVGRKVTDNSVEIGSVGIHGQRLTIAIITDEYLPLQRCYKCKYEVLSKGSPYRGNVDIAFTTEIMSARHTYYVLLNDDPKNPTIRKVIRERERLAPLTPAKP